MSPARLQYSVSIAIGRRGSQSPRDLSPLPARSFTHLLTHSLTHSVTHSLTRVRFYSLTYTPRRTSTMPVDRANLAVFSIRWTAIMEPSKAASLSYHLHQPARSRLLQPTAYSRSRPPLLPPPAEPATRQRRGICEFYDRPRRLRATYAPLLMCAMRATASSAERDRVKFDSFFNDDGRPRRFCSTGKGCLAGRFFFRPDLGKSVRGRTTGLLIGIARRRIYIIQRRGADIGWVWGRQSTRASTGDCNLSGHCYSDSAISACTSGGDTTVNYGAGHLLPVIRRESWSPILFLFI